MIETHYSNPSYESGLYDPGSGFRLYLSPTLRSISVGTWMLGARADPRVTPSIPAGQSNYSMSFPADCTGDQNYGIARGGSVTVLSILSHMHVTGKSGYLSQVRNGVEQQPIQSMPYFDFTFQTILFKTNKTKIYSGDILVTKCVWDTSSDYSDVTFGPGTHNEMCLSFVDYYPAQPSYFTSGGSLKSSGIDYFYCLNNAKSNEVFAVDSNGKSANNYLSHSYSGSTCEAAAATKPTSSTQKTTATTTSVKYGSSSSPAKTSSKSKTTTTAKYGSIRSSTTKTISKPTTASTVPYKATTTKATSTSVKYGSSSKTSSKPTTASSVPYKAITTKTTSSKPYSSPR